MSRGIVDAGYGFAVLVVAGGVEGLFGEDLAGDGAGDGDDAVDDFQFHGPSGVLSANVDGASPARDAVLRDAAAWVDLVPSGEDGDIDSGRFDAFGDGDGPFACGPGGDVPFVFLPVTSGLFPRGDPGVEAGLALRLVRLFGRCAVSTRVCLFNRKWAV